MVAPFFENETPTALAKNHKFHACVHIHGLNLDPVCPNKCWRQDCLRYPVRKQYAAEVFTR